MNAVTTTTLSLPRPIIIRASAGTGKTYRLARQIIQLLVLGADVESFLATTFTRKAAGEILQRLMQRLADAAVDAKALDDLNKMVDPAVIDHDQAAELLHRLSRQIGRVRICTLDSFFAQVARGFGMELGLPSGWRMADPAEEQSLLRAAVGNTVRNLPQQQLRTLIAQLAKGELRRQVTRDVETVVQGGYELYRRAPDSAWDSLPTPRGAAQQEVTRALGILETVDAGNKTTNKACRKLAELYSSESYQEALETTLVQRISAGDTLFNRKELDAEIVDACRVIAAAARVHVLDLLKTQTAATHAILQAYDRHSTQLRESSRVFTFDDIAHRIAGWLAGERGYRADQAYLAYRLDMGVEHLLLDEFQDTAPIQWRVLDPLARHTVGREGRTFFCVGDVKQAIYRWRGGEAAIFAAVEQQFEELEQEGMDASYRSSPVVIDVVNRVFNGLTRHPRAAEFGAAIGEFARHFPEHRAVNPLPGYVQIKTGPDTTRLEEKKQRQTVHWDDVAAHIAELHHAHPGHSIGVLTRTNDTVGALIYRLRQSGLQVSQEGGNPLTDSAAVDLILSAFRLADSPGDKRWYFHLMHSPLADLITAEGASDASRIAQYLRMRLLRDGLVATVRWLAVPLLEYCDARDQTRVNQLIDLAVAQQTRVFERWSQFVALVENQRVATPQQAMIRVMTIHQAKGLEFDCVVLPELDGELTRVDNGSVARYVEPAGDPVGVLHYVGKKLRHILPPEWQQAFVANDQGALTESLCLLYVALTRARNALHVLIAPAKKPSFDSKTASSLIYHALGASDPTQSESLIFEAGDSCWYEQADAASSVRQEPPIEVTLRLKKPNPTPRRGFWRGT